MALRRRPSSAAAAAAAVAGCCVAAAFTRGAALALEERVPVPGGQGCHAIVDRSACCLFVDGRRDGYYGGQECVPARVGGQFNVGVPGPGPVCQPICWAKGTCGGLGDQTAVAESCAAAPSIVEVAASKAARMVLPPGVGCSQVADRAACCLFRDGRSGEPAYAGQDCVPARGSAVFPVPGEGPGTMCEPSSRVLGTFSGSSDLSAHAGFCGAPELVALAETAVAEQAEARVAPGGSFRFYVVGSSNAAWQAWPEQLHAMLRRLGYLVTLPRTDIPGEAFGPHGRRTPKCDDAADFEGLPTPTLGLQGWSTWGFAYEGPEDCDGDGFRNIAGWNVSCTNGWACTEKWRGDVPFVPVSTLAKGVRDADVVVLANFVNDGRTAQMVAKDCFAGALPDVMQTTDITVANLRRTIRAIHAENPSVVVLVLARYADAREVYVNHVTLPTVDAINAAVKAGVETEPNTHFVDLAFPVDIEMFQTLNTGHANCRGDKIMATTVVNALFKHRVLAKGFAAGDASCLGRADCAALDHGCCQRSALCHINAESRCVRYGPGLQ